MNFPKFRFIIACLSCYLSLVMSGVCLSWTEPLTQLYLSADSPLSLSKAQISILVSLVEAGALLSPLPAGLLADRLGRKWTLVLSSVVAGSGFVLSSLGRQSLLCLCVGRLLTGLTLGAAPTVAPIYLAEISPADIRGALCGQLTTTFFLGQLLVYSTGHSLSYGVYLWSLVGSPLLAGLCSLSSPESPSYLLSKGRPGEASRSLEQLRGTFDQAEFEVTRAALQGSAPGCQDSRSSAGWRELFKGQHLRTFLVLQVLSFVSHTNGLPTLSLFTTTTFPDQPWLSLALGGLLAGSSALAALLADPVGRRPMLAASLLGTALATGLLTGYFFTSQLWLLYLGLVTFCIFSSIGISPIIMTLQGELFPISIRSIASALTEITLAISSFLSLVSYLPVSDAFGMEVNFLAYTGLSLLGLGVLVCLPETARTNIDARQQSTEDLVGEQDRSLVF